MIPFQPTFPPFPGGLGLDPNRFPEWRKSQLDLIQRLSDSDCRFVGANIATGGGKSLGLIASALTGWFGDRACILTGTKALQDQYQGDFADIAQIIKGSNSYQCDIEPARTAKSAPCRFGYDCDLKRGGCGYYDTIRRARDSGLVVANYAAFVSHGRAPESALGDFGFLGCDEAHSLEDNALSAMAIEIPFGFFYRFSNWLNFATMDTDKWFRYFFKHMPDLIAHVDELEQSGGDQERRDAKKYLETLDDLRYLQDYGSGRYFADQVWTGEAGKNKTLRAVTFTPASIENREMIFQDAGVVALVSANLTAAHLERFGIEPHEFDFVELPSEFNPKLSPFYVMKNAPPMGYKTRDANFPLWMGQCDQIIGNRLDRKGIIQAHSFERTKLIMSRSRYAPFMFANINGETLPETLARFRAAKPPAILVSPSVSEGYDFPGDMCRYQILTNVGFPNTQSELMAARVKLDPELSVRLAMQGIVQKSGRGTRSIHDWCEIFGLDGQFRYFMHSSHASAKYSPGWFRRTIQWVDQAPMPPRLNY